MARRSFQASARSRACIRCRAAATWLRARMGWGRRSRSRSPRDRIAASASTSSTTASTTSRRHGRVRCSSYYFATGRLDPDIFAQLVEGMTAACRASGCALLGGETAEMPGVYALGDYDLAGFIVGLVEPGAHRKAIQPGDALVGLPSSGLHTNGYSLARKVFEDVPPSHVFRELGRPLGEVLLESHTSYLDELGRIPWKGAAHITGGGILGNLARCLPDGLGARLERGSWRVPPIFELIRKRGRVADDEMDGTFNMGLGMILVVDREELPDGAKVVGEVVSQTGPDRVVIR